MISRNSTELNPASCMRVICRVHGLGPSRTLKQNVLPLILLILLAKLTNQKRGIYRHHIFYPIRLRPSFPNDGKILKPKVGLGPDQIINWLKEGFNGKQYSFMNKIKLFLKNKGHENLRTAYAYMRMHMQAWYTRTHTRIHIYS